MRSVINAGCAYTVRLVDMAEGSPERASHGLLPEEREAIIALSKDETHADLSHRQLAVVSSENGRVEAGASSFYRVMKEEEQGSREKAEDAPDQAGSETCTAQRDLELGLNVYTFWAHICVSVRHH